MAYIIEQLKHPFLEFDIEIDVLEKDDETLWRPHAIIDLNMMNLDFMTPGELMEIGRWFQEVGERVRKEYTATGKKKTSQ